MATVGTSTGMHKCEEKDERSGHASRRVRQVSTCEDCFLPTQGENPNSTYCDRAVAAAAAAAAGCNRARVRGVRLMMTLVLRGTA